MDDTATPHFRRSEPAAAPASASDLGRFALQAARDERTDQIVYQRLAASARTPRLRAVLAKFAAEEKEHYEFWAARASGDVRASMVKIRVMLFLRWLLGITFVVKQLEREETRTIRAYQDALAFVPAADVPALEKMIRDEQEHEEALVADIEERRVQYLSFIVLGLADALVEIAGIHAGSLGIYNTTRLAGLAGVIAGAAASVAMASAAYAQAKQGSFRGSAVVSAAFTGVSYFVAALILAAPYFVTSVMIVALVFSLLGGFVLLALSTYYNSVVTGSRFGKDFLEIAAVMVGATVLLYILGTLIRAYLGLSI